MIALTLGNVVGPDFGKGNVRAEHAAPRNPPRPGKVMPDTRMILDPFLEPPPLFCKPPVVVSNTKFLATSDSFAGVQIMQRSRVHTHHNPAAVGGVN